MSKSPNGPKIVPQLSSKEKLEQIRSGKVLQRRKSGLDIKAMVVTGKDGTKIVQKKMTEKYEETTVKRKKRNYVMYESKLGTEKNTEIRSIAKPKKKPSPVRRSPSPRKEDRIIIVRKRPQYLDNYQYHETKMLKHKQPSIVLHRRLASAIYDNNYSTITTNVGRSPRLTDNKSDLKQPKRPAVTTTDFYKRPNNALNAKTPKIDVKMKSKVVTKQIMSRRNASPQSAERRMDISQSPMNNSRTRGKPPQTPYQTVTTKKTTKTTTIINRRGGDSGNRPKSPESSGYKTITVNTRSRRNKIN